MKYTVLSLIVMSLMSAASAQTPAGDRSALLVFEPEFFAASAPSTAKDMVDRLPGFQLDDGDDVRGFAGAGGNVLIDGARPASKTDDVSAVLGRIHANQVAHIELIRGSSSGIDMQGHSVVANVVLSDAASSQHALTARGFFFEGGPNQPGGRYDYTSSENGRSWGVNISKTISMSDSTGPGRYIRRDADGDVITSERSNRSFDGGGWSGRVNWAAPVWSGRIELTAGANVNDYEEATRFSAVSSQRRFGFDQDNTNADLGARLEQTLSSSMTLESRFIQNLRSNESTSTALAEQANQRFDTERDTGESILRTSLQWQQSDRLSIESSAELAYNFLDTRQSFTVNSIPVVLPLSTTKVNELRGELSSIASWKTSDSLTLEAGVRLERSRIRQSGGSSAERSFSYPKPRLGLAWDVRDNHQLRMRVERELGQLNFSDFAASSSLSNNEVLGGNLDLRPEQRWISEAIYEYRFAGNGALTLTYRHDEIRDVVDVLPLDDGLTAIGNIGDGTLDRAALNLRLPLDRIGLGGARLTVDAQYDHTRVTDPTTGRERPISEVRPFTGFIRMEQDVPQANLVWGFQFRPYFRETTFNPDQRRSMELHDFLTLFGEYTISTGFTARLEYNIWDDFRLYRTSWADRDTQTVAFTEEERINPRNYVQFQLRKTF